MATPVHRLIQNQNLNLPYNGGKIDLSKTEKKGVLGGRKALNDISNSRKPIVKSTNVLAIEKDPFAGKPKPSKAPEKGKNGGRKALTDLTNSVKVSSSQQVSRVGRKLNTVLEENITSSMVDERFLHNHQKCIKAQMKSVDVDYFLESIGLNNDISARPSAMRARQSSSKKHLEMKDISEQPFEDELQRLGYCSPACQSPKSPKPPYVNWDDEIFSDLTVIETPKLLYP